MTFVRLFSEALGCYVELPDRPRRIVSLAPSITETLYEIGAWDEVVGVSEFCRRPAQAELKPRVGSYLTVDYSKLRELRPDLILSSTGAQLSLAMELKSKGYPVYPLPLPTTVYGILETVLNVGRIVGRCAEAFDLTRRLLSTLRRLLEERVNVRGYYEVFLGTPVTVGRFSFITSSLKVVGINHILEDVAATYLEPDASLLKSHDCEVVVYELGEGGPKSSRDVYGMLERRGLGWEALRRKRVVLLQPDTLTSYGPSHFEHLAALLREVKRLL
ncbi:MAG TPA: CRISPR-associated protein Cas5 [Aquificaceae bacterium]|nr:CRISPR-associated protein Cas5 [Aquificaceae bacterium]